MDVFWVFKPVIRCTEIHLFKCAISLWWLIASVLTFSLRLFCGGSACWTSLCFSDCKIGVDCLSGGNSLLFAQLCFTLQPPAAPRCVNWGSSEAICLRLASGIYIDSTIIRTVQKSRISQGTANSLIMSADLSSLWRSTCPASDVGARLSGRPADIRWSAWQPAGGDSLQNQITIQIALTIFPWIWFCA